MFRQMSCRRIISKINFTKAVALFLAAAVFFTSTAPAYAQSVSAKPPAKRQPADKYLTEEFSKSDYLGNQKFDVQKSSNQIANFLQYVNDRVNAGKQYNDAKNDAKKQVLEIEELFMPKNESDEKNEKSDIPDKMTFADFKRMGVAHINQEYKKTLEELDSIDNFERYNSIVNPEARQKPWQSRTLQSRIELEEWKKEALGTIPADYEQYSAEYDNALKEYHRQEEESIKAVGILLRDFYLQYPIDPDIKRVAENTALFFYAIENIRKDLFEAKNYRNILIANYKEYIKNNGCEKKYFVEKSYINSRTGMITSVHVEKSKFDQKICADTIDKIYALSIISDEENIQEITEFMSKYVKTPYAPILLGPVVSFLLGTKRHEMLFNFISQQEQAEINEEYDGTSIVDAGASYLKYYLGSVSQHGDYPIAIDSDGKKKKLSYCGINVDFYPDSAARGNIWEDIGCLIAQDAKDTENAQGNAASKKFVAERLANIFLQGEVDSLKTKVVIKTIAPLFVGMLLGGGTTTPDYVNGNSELEGVSNLHKVLETYGKETVPLKNIVVQNRNKDESSLLEGYFGKKHYYPRAHYNYTPTMIEIFEDHPENPMSVMFQKYGDASISLSIILFNSSMIDLPADYKRALDAKLYHFYMKNGGDTNWFEMYSKHTKRYKDRLDSELNKAAVKIMIISLNVALTIWSFCTLPALFISLAKALNSLYKGVKLIGTISKVLYTAKSLKALKTIPELAGTYKRLHRFALIHKKIAKNTKDLFKNPKVYFREIRIKKVKNSNPTFGEELKVTGYTEEGFAKVSGGAFGETVANYKANLDT
ncbi:MAG: hypothetical protein LBG16_02010, partial [Elusimicrobiota bacterium]|nr:hypothetical protein [Elusimicrobiota bacterium]